MICCYVKLKAFKVFFVNVYYARGIAAIDAKSIV